MQPIKRRVRALSFALAVLLSLFLAACASSAPGATPKPVPTLKPTSTPRPKPTLPSQRPTPTPSPTQKPAPSPSPTPAPLPEGDFSYTFPKEDTGRDAEQSYQSGDVRIAINGVSKNGVAYYVADVWVRKIDFLRTAFAKDKFGKSRERILKIMDRHDAILAISGDYYGMRPNGVVVRNGESYRDAPLYDVCALYKNGEMKTFLSGEWNQEREMANGALQAWGFGPMLLDKSSRPMTEFSGIEKERLNPRAAIGYYEPGHYCFVLVDGRREGHSKGMLLSELSALFFELGCKAAYNLDGGQTAMLAFEGEYVNIPFKDGRAQTDIIYVGVGEETAP